MFYHKLIRNACASNGKKLIAMTNSKRKLNKTVYSLIKIKKKLTFILVYNSGFS